MQLAEVPIPIAVAGRPRDPRGVPVPAVTAWEAGDPVFREASGPRQLLCALQNGCSVCGGPIGADGVWHVVDEPAAKLIRYALARGAEPAAALVTPEVPGHRACILYAAVACPYLGHATARRTITAPDHSPGRVMAPIPEGTRRGALSAVVEFGHCLTRTVPEQNGFEVALSQPHTIYTYHQGSELLPQLLDAIESEPPRPPFSDLFGPDDRTVVRELRRALTRAQLPTHPRRPRR